MRPPPLPLLATLFLWTGLAGGGCLAPPRAEDWLAVGFRTPEQTFATFQTGLRADQPSLEYRCLSQSFKAREGVNELAYREFRERLFGENPWLRHAAAAEVVEVVELSPRRARIVARVEKLFVERSFTVELVSEGYYELRAGSVLADDDFHDFASTLSSEGGELRLRLPLAPGVDPQELSEVRAGREWKIDGFDALRTP